MYEDLKPKICTCARLRSTTRTITRAYETALKPSGLNANQFSLLNNLPAKKDGLAHSKLAKALNLDRTTLTRNLVPLERDGLLTIEGGEDQRVKVISITRKGRARLKVAMPLWQAVQGGVMRKLGLKKWEKAQALLTELSEAVT